MHKALIVAVVVAASLAAGITALGTFHLDRTIAVGSVRLSVDPGHRGALDLYVPVVDWGVRFPVVRLPARVNVDVRAVDRAAVVRLAGAGSLDTRFVRSQARDALAFYLRLAILFSVAAALAFGMLVALAVRGGRGPRVRTTIAAAAVTALAGGVALVVLLPPRSNVDTPQYYANGPEVPTALRTLESFGSTTRSTSSSSVSHGSSPRRPAARRSSGCRVWRSPPTCTTTSSRCRRSSAWRAAARCCSSAISPTAAPCSSSRSCCGS
jgi:hypothetical protein